MRSLWLLLFIICLPHLARALIPGDPLNSSQRFFFKSPLSLFPSGEATLDSLSRSQMQQTQQTWVLVTTLAHQQWLDRNDLYLSSEIKWQNRPTQEALLLQATKLFIVRGNKAISVAQISAGEKLEVESLDGVWAWAHWHGSKYLVFSDHLLLPFDFGGKILLKNKEAGFYNFRKGAQIFLRDRAKPIALSDIQDLHPLPQVAILKRDLTLRPEAKLSKLFQGQRLKVEKIKTLNWSQSLVEGHGAVWWKLESENAQEERKLTTRDLLGRQIHDFARSPKGEPIALASSSGVFLTEDGKNWKQLTEFGSQNWPVAIADKDTLVVGSRISKDRGREFQDFIKWEDVALKTQQLLKRPPQFLLLKSMKVKNIAGVNKIILDIDTGWKVLQFAVPLNAPESKLLRL